MSHRIAGKSIAAMGVVTLLASAAACLYLDAFVCDLTAFIVIAIGLYVSEGSLTAARWGLAVMIIDLLIAVALMLTLCVDPGQVRFDGRSMGTGALRWAFGVIGALTVWSLANLLLLLRVLRTERHRRQYQCTRCGYPIGKAPSCTECGHVVTEVSGAS